MSETFLKTSVLLLLVCNSVIKHICRVFYLTFYCCFPCWNIEFVLSQDVYWTCKLYIELNHKLRFICVCTKYCRALTDNLVAERPDDLEVAAHVYRGHSLAGFSKYLWKWTFTELFNKSWKYRKIYFLECNSQLMYLTSWVKKPLLKHEKGFSNVIMSLSTQNLYWYINYRRNVKSPRVC